jgi:hypothetical protein
MGNQAVVDRCGGQHPDGVEPKGPKRSTQAKTRKNEDEAAQVAENDEYGPKAVKHPPISKMQMCPALRHK